MHNVADQNGLENDSKEIVIDWTYITRDAVLEDLIAWVKNSPTGQKIHVFIPSSRVHSQVRMLHHTLQSLGCRVTRRTFQASSSVPCHVSLS